MSQTDSAPLWTGPQEFEGLLESLLLTACRGTVTFDRSWTFRREDDHPDFMVEVTRLSSTPDTPQSGGVSTMDEAEFETELSSLLRDAHLSGIGFDRAWTFRCADGLDLMVEITRLAKR